MGDTSFIFGTVTAAHNGECIDDLRRLLNARPRLQWMRQAVGELPSYWDLLASRIPAIDGSFPGRQRLLDFHRWLRHGFNADEDTATAGNTVLLPLVVMVGLTEFWEHVERHATSQGPLEALASTGNLECIGLCAGMLTAFAVASSHSRADFEKYGAVAIRLAMMVGAVLDFQDAKNSPAKSYVASWRTPEQGEQLQRSIDLVYPQAYLSVLYDERRVTITTTAQWIRSTILRQLKGAGLTVAESSIQGRPHCPDTESKELSDALCELARSTPDLQLGNASGLALRTYTNDGHANPVSEGSLHEVALRGSLATQSRWYETFAALSLAQTDSIQAVVSFGPDRCIPPSLIPALGKRWTHVSELNRLAAEAVDIDTPAPGLATPASLPETKPETPSYPENTIAIVGMSLKSAGADDVEEFSRMIQSGVSQHEEIKPDRLKFHTLWREGDWDPSYKWYANWMQDVDKFDHQFFKKSPREAANMDPQQRLALQAAYQAVDKAGYYAGDRTPNPSSSDPNHVGVYVGITLDDYQNHVRSHRANAFCITGTMRSLIAGKIAHQFGWTGPAMTVDTACSSSAVAIHNACRDLLAGDCNAALAGGANVITDPLAFQDLAAAGFLSPTGQCKPFDDQADGYCRGEAVGFVFMKRLSDALADGNQILGCISSSAIYQNENHTPIFVPNSPSLSGLFRHVLSKGHVQPSEISLVECHGTGTPVGDPAEWESVRDVLQVSDKTDPIYVGSAKGHIGHTEAASGVVALIKVLSTLQTGQIPPQASHSRLNHLIQPSNVMKIANSPQPWTATPKTALINNYGASGSNVAMIVTEFESPKSSPVEGDLPFCIAGRTASSVKSNCARLAAYLATSSVNASDLSFNLHRQFNRSLPYRLAFKSSSVDELKTNIAQVSDASISNVQPNRPVVLCFGGQVSNSIGLDRTLYERTGILRHYLDECDSTIKSLGLASIYPDIFSYEPVKDPQRLQLMLFAVQYSSAMSWLQSGLSSQVAAVVGHSFGELSALCISGILTLQDAIKLVAGRAKLIRDFWGSDPGAMLALEAEENEVEALLSEAKKEYIGPHPASIACYNGLRSFTVAGSQQAITSLSDLISQKHPHIRSKALKVTNAFHSSLVDPLQRELEQLGHEITFHAPRIPFERATETHFPTEDLGPVYVAEQMRKPVFFRHAIQRLAQKYPDCVWLEAGSNATVTVMAQRALDASSRSSHHFQGINITDSDAFNKLSEVTVALYKAGVSTSFWPHNAIQTRDYANIVLPPYQFEKERHWVDLGDPVEKVEQIKEAVRAEVATTQTQPVIESHDRWTFTGYKSKNQPSFRINTSLKDYQDLVHSHVVANTAGICSGMLQVDLAVGALFSIHPDWTTRGLRASLHDMIQYTPVCLDQSRALNLEFDDQGNGFWDWKIVSLSGSASPIVHTTARLQVRDPTDSVYQTEFRRLGRLIDHSRCLNVLNLGPSHDGVQILQGRSVYQAFHDIVDFGEQYRSMRWLVGTSTESAGRLARTSQNDRWFDQLRGEHISQVGGIWVNCLTDHNPSDLFVGAQIEMWMASPDWANRPLPRELDVLARHQYHPDTGDYTTDSFVFDPSSGELLEVLLGVRFTRTSIVSFARALQRMTPGQGTKPQLPPSIPSAPAPPVAPVPEVQKPSLPQSQPASQPATVPAAVPRRDLLKEMGEVVAELVGVDVTEIGPDANLADFGVDSLLGMELLGEIKSAFECEPDEVEIMGATTLRDLVRCLPIADTVDEPPKAAVDPHSSALSTDSDWTQPSLEPSSGASDMLWETADVMEAFNGTKSLGDQMLQSFGLDNFDSAVIPKSNEMCAALVVDCFEHLGCPLRTAQAGQVLDRIPFEKQHRILADYIYNFLDKTVNLIDIQNDGKVTRSATPVPTASSQEILDELVAKYPAHADFHRLTHHAGKHLAQALSGKTDGNRILMGDAEGRRLCQSVYHEYSVNRIGFDTMRDVLERVSTKIRPANGPLRILEVGGGTASATTALLPLLASLDVAVEYTFTDLSSSLVAQARRTLGKEYPFMKFAVQDIEKPVGDDLAGKQHIVIGSHCVHATRSLADSTRNIRHALRPEGFLMMFEMREAWPALDLPFGLYEGWWLFEDGRTHAYTSHETWQRSLTDAGYGAVNWTDGQLPEHKYYMVLIACVGSLAK
ncbi:hypothetical protein BDV18DRAFT_161654 [Aspergillus unguis]